MGNLESANTGFAFNLLGQLMTEQPGSNVFPFRRAIAASTVLQMVGTGAAGATSTQMQEALGTEGIPLQWRLEEANKEASTGLIQQWRYERCSHNGQRGLVSQSVPDRNGIPPWQ